MDRTVQKIYLDHHRKKGRYGFSFEVEARAAILREWIGRGKSILDIGCRDGSLTRRILEGNRVVGVDIDPHALQRMKRDTGAEVLLHNINTPLPFADCSFDVVHLGEILEHTIFPDLVIKEAVRLLKPSGLLAGSVPNAYRIKNRLMFLMGKRFDPDATHLHFFSPEDLKNLLKDQLKLLEIRFAFGRLVKIQPRWFANTMLFRARKPANDEHADHF